MKIGDWVHTSEGSGFIKKLEGQKGTRTERYGIDIQGLGTRYFWKSEIEYWPQDNLKIGDKSQLPF